MQTFSLASAPDVLCTGVIPTSPPPNRLLPVAAYLGSSWNTQAWAPISATPRDPNSESRARDRKAPGPRLYAAPHTHTSVPFTWCSRSLAPGLKLKIGTQPAFVGERKEGRKEDFGQRRQHTAPSRKAGGPELGGRPGGPGAVVTGGQVKVTPKVGWAQLPGATKGQGSNLDFVEWVMSW